MGTSEAQGIFLQKTLEKYSVVPIIDPQVKHSYGKLRSLGLIAHCLGGKSLGCFRPRAVFTQFPSVEIYTPRNYVDGKPPSYEYYCALTSQREEENQGLVSRNLDFPPFFAVIDSSRFTPKDFDRQLVPWIGISHYYPYLYQQLMKQRAGPQLIETRNFFFQYYYEQYLALSNKSRAEFMDLFNFDDPNTLTFPWWRWLPRWAFLMKKYRWFRSKYQTHIRRSLALWIEDKKTVDKVELQLLYLIETRFGNNPDRIIKEVNNHILNFRKRNIKSKG